MNHEGVCRTAPATPGLLTTLTPYPFNFFLNRFSRMLAVCVSFNVMSADFYVTIKTENIISAKCSTCSNFFGGHLRIIV